MGRKVGGKCLPALRIRFSPQKWRHFEDPKTPLRNTGSNPEKLEGPRILRVGVVVLIFVTENRGGKFLDLFDRGVL